MADGDVAMSKEGGGVSSEEELAGQDERVEDQLSAIHAAAFLRGLSLPGPGVGLNMG